MYCRRSLVTCTILENASLFALPPIEAIIEYLYETLNKMVLLVVVRISAAALLIA